MLRSTPLLCLASIVLVLSNTGLANQRGVLWRVVQACVAAHDLTGLAFPCLAVDTTGGVERGYAVLRGPLDTSHIIVTPTVRTIGIEAERLRAPDAPNYFADAWAAHPYATDGLPRPPTRDDLAMAVNSRRGRSQDQLHIHVDCIRQSVKKALAQAAGTLDAHRWSQLVVLPHAPRYAALLLPSADLEGINIFDVVTKGLEVAPDDVDDTTIVVVGASEPKPGFIVLARQRIVDTLDEAHGEALMDHSCSAFR